VTGAALLLTTSSLRVKRYLSVDRNGAAELEPLAVVVDERHRVAANESTPEPCCCHSVSEQSAVSPTRRSAATSRIRA